MSGWMFAFHGAQKLFGIFAPAQMPPMTVGSQMWFGGVIELVCGLMIALGFLASGTMAVAYTQFHWKLKLNSNFFPGVNQGELAVVYCFVFFLIACQGGGQYRLGRKD